MANWVIEMEYGIGFSVEVDAENREEAIKKAKALVSDTTIVTSDNSVDESGLEFQEATFIQNDI